MLHKMECGSLCTGRVAEGCRHCIDGSKMVLFVTGRCGWNCYYCPVSLEKKGKDVIYANEGRVYTDDEIIAEAEAMDATGTGITGGDPLLDMDRTVHMIRLLKDRRGSRMRASTRYASIPRSPCGRRCPRPGSGRPSSPWT